MEHALREVTKGIRGIKAIKAIRVVKAIKALTVAQPALDFFGTIQLLNSEGEAQGSLLHKLQS